MTFSRCRLRPLRLLLLATLAAAPPAFAQDAADEEAVEPAVTVEAEDADETEAAEEQAAEAAEAEEPEAAAEEADEEMGAGDVPDTTADAVEERIELDAEDLEEEPERGPKWLDGRLRLSLDTAWSDDENDFNLDQYLNVNIQPTNIERLSLHGALSVHEDLDGDEASTSALRDIHDAFNEDVRARLYQLYAQWEDGWGDSTLRLGRQRIYESPAFNRMDGIYWKQRLQKWEYYVFAGARASLYTDSHDDLVAGGGGSWFPTPLTRVSLDFYYGDDHRDTEDLRGLRFLHYLMPWYHTRSYASEVDDTMLALSLWQNLTDNLQFHGRYLFINGDSDELTLDLLGYVPPIDVTFELTYRQLLNRVSERGNDLTAYYRVLGPQEEYKHIGIILHKPLTEKIIASLETEFHNAENDSSLTANRDYWRVAAILAAEDIRPGFDGSIALERWDVDDGEGVWAITGEVTKEWDRLEWSVGADYERYKDEILDYNPVPLFLSQTAPLIVPGLPGFPRLAGFFDTVSVETRENIYSIYTGLRYSLRDNQELSAKVTFEDDDSSEAPYWRIEAAYELDF